MPETTPLNIKSLKEQVYEYLRSEFHQQNLEPGSMIDMEATSRKLGISKTPLRDALIQLEMEGFVTIIPRRGIYVNPLSIQDIKDYYQIIGALESSAFTVSLASMSLADIDRMQELNERMGDAIKADDFDLFYDLNLNFHNVYISLCRNDGLIRIVNNLKKRLYDFPRRKQWIKEWEEASILEHQQLVDLIRVGNAQGAVSFIHDVHWSFKVQERWIKRYYAQPDESNK